ncbi:MAG: LutC/YkgG family protein [Thermodesulfobacteriota bacterium]
MNNPANAGGPQTRDRILGRLERALSRKSGPVFFAGPGNRGFENAGDDIRYASEPLPAPDRSPAKRLERLKRLLEAMRAEVHLVPESDWQAELGAYLRKREFGTALYGPGSEVGEAVKAQCGEAVAPEAIPYAEPVESFKERLFGGIDVGVTSARSAIAENGALVLWPDEKEPRLMSLIPPVHIAVLRASDIHNTFADAMAAEDWAAGVPTNVVLISGPSKTADIELVLAFGIHGPKELVVFIRADEA